MGWSSFIERVIPPAVVSQQGGLFFTSPVATAFTTFLVTANRLYGTPFLVPDKKTYVSITLEVTTAIAGNARMGIYRDNGGYPGALVLDAGVVTTGTLGAKTIVISQSLDPGWYWLAVVHDAAPTVRALSQSNALIMLGFTSATDTTIHVGLDVAFTYAALPDPFTAGGTLLTTAVHRILLGT